MHLVKVILEFLLSCIDNHFKQRYPINLLPICIYYKVVVLLCALYPTSVKFSRNYESKSIFFLLSNRNLKTHYSIFITSINNVLWTVMLHLWFCLRATNDDAEVKYSIFKLEAQKKTKKIEKTTIAQHNPYFLVDLWMKMTFFSPFRCYIFHFSLHFHLKTKIKRVLVYF